MPKEKPIQVITPPNALKAKIGGSLPTLDAAAIKRAETALQQLSSEFGDWVSDEVAKLVSAWEEFETSTGHDAKRDDLHRAAHDLKGLAPTYGYPLVGRIAYSLSRLTDPSLIAIERVPHALLRAHVDAVRAAIHHDIKDENHPVGSVLAAELETKTRDLLAAA